MAAALPKRAAPKDPRRFVADPLAAPTKLFADERVNREVVADATGIGSELHPVVYRVVIASATVFLVASWWGFGGGGMDLLFAPATLIFLMMCAIPMIFHLVGSRVDNGQKDLLAFLNDRIETGAGPLSGAQILVQIAIIPVCLAFAAVALAIISRSVGA
jgi:hypothetical protein